MEENKEKEEEHEIDDSKERSQVSLKQEDIELYYDIKEEIGKYVFVVLCTLIIIPSYSSLILIKEAPW